MCTRFVIQINIQKNVYNDVFQTRENRFNVQVYPDTDWKTTLTAQKCPTNDESLDEELMPAIQPQPAVTEIGIRMPNIGRGNSLKI